MPASGKFKLMHLGIYDPYLDTLGGGERYCLTIAEIASNLGHQVDLFWSGDPQVLSQAASRFSLELSAINLVPDVFHLSLPLIEPLVDSDNSAITVSQSPTPVSFPQKINSFITKIKITRQYDKIFFLSNGSIPLLAAKENYLHTQVPFATKISPLTYLQNSFKYLFITKNICNSKFTSKFTQNYFGRKNIVLYPPVDVEKFSPSSNKQKQILSVGRFDNILNAKKQDILIQAFTKFFSLSANTGWKLVLAGGSHQSPEKNSYLQLLKKMADKIPVEFHVNPSFAELQKLYADSQICWHAAGFAVDELLHPESTEHFGISLVEAMAAGAVPLGVKRGGIPEIITDGQDGFLWEDVDTLIAKTNLLVASPETLSTMSEAAITKSKIYSKNNFKNNLLQILNFT